MSTETNDPQSKLALIFASILLRLWLGVRALQTGIEKYSGLEPVDKTVEIDGAPNAYNLTDVEMEKVYGMEHYHGVPGPLMETFKGEPLMMGWALGIYDMVLGPALILLGLAILAGVASRCTLMLLGLLYVSLTWGLILMGQQGAAGVSWLGVHMIMIVMALMLSEHNRLCVLKKW
jgi:thiosulfate dehydrogenase [quinone] large subunit